MKTYIAFLLSIFLCLVAFSSFAQAKLPANIQWQTNEDDFIFEDYAPKKGGVFYDYITSFPLTFRLYGPNSNSGGFVSYNRAYAFMSLTTINPNTQNVIPQLATHWAIMDDKKTVYYKLDQDARWSDGEKITADDYLFGYEFLQSKDIQAPFYNQYMRNHFETVEKIDDYTLKLVAKKPSWRILDELDLTPLPRHAIQLDKDWVKNYQWKPNVVPGPYVIKKFKKGRSIEFQRIKDWWGKDKRYFKNKYNFDTIVLRVIRNDAVAYEQFKKEKLSVFRPNSLVWAKKTAIKEIQNGYINKQRIFKDVWTGVSGIFFNTQKGIWSDKNLRQAFAYTIDFATMNKNLFFDLYQRKHHFFDVIAPYKKADQRTYAYDLEKAHAVLENAGWKKTESSRQFREKDGQLLELDIFTANDEALRFLSFIKQSAEKAGIKVNLHKKDGATFFKGINERNFTAFSLGFGGGRYPSPRQFFHSDNLKKYTNNLMMFANEELDRLIDVYEFDLDEQKRIDAIERIEEIVHENVPVVFYWTDPADKLLWWKYIKGPKQFIYKIGYDNDLLYYDQSEFEIVQEAIKQDKKLPILPLVYDPYDLIVR